MKIHRFIISANLAIGSFDVLDKDLIHQWNKVLKFKVKDKINLIDNTGREFEAEIDQYLSSLVKINVIKLVKDSKLNKKEVILYCAILKKDNLELVCQKATEIGVAKIVPVITSRTVKFNFKKDRILRIIKEATEQSGGLFMPEFLEPVNFIDVINDSGFDTRLFFDVNQTEVYKPINLPEGKIALMVGPEGGWSDEEVNLALAKKWTPISLGEKTLRAETAAIIASYLAVNF